jgi:hypothetical protein
MAPACVGVFLTETLNQLRDTRELDSICSLCVLNFVTLTVST